jgi:hypothetical protein
MLHRAVAVNPLPVDKPPSLSRRRSYLRLGALILALFVAYLLPRMIALREVEVVSALVYRDMPAHAFMLDMLTKTLFGGALEKPKTGLDLEYHPRWPHGTYYVASLFSRSFGPISIWTSQLTNFFFSILLVAGVIGLGTVAGSLRVGLWGALLVLLCPPIAGASYYLCLDYPLLGMTTLGAYLLSRTSGFQRRGPSLVFGVFSGFALWIKVSYPIYLFFPALAVLIGTVRRHEARKMRPVVNSILAMVLAALVAFVLLQPRLGALWTEFSNHMAPSTATRPHEFPSIAIRSFTIEWFLALIEFAAMSYPLPLLLLAVPGIVLLHRKGSMKDKGLWLGLLWGSFCFLTLMTSKLERYNLPLYPFFCLATVWSVTRLIPRRWQTAALVWIATAYASVLVLVYEHPTPWRFGLKNMGSDFMFYDLRMPIRQELDRNYHWMSELACPLQPLYRELSLLDRLEPKHRPVTVLLEMRSSDFVSILGEDLMTIALQQYRDRYVMHNISVERPDLEPVLAIFHSNAFDPRPLLPRYRTLSRRSFVMDCSVPGPLARSPKRVPMVLTLMLDSSGPRKRAPKPL